MSVRVDGVRANAFQIYRVQPIIRIESLHLLSTWLWMQQAGFHTIPMQVFDMTLSNTIHHQALNAIILRGNPAAHTSNGCHLTLTSAFLSISWSSHESTTLEENFNGEYYFCSSECLITVVGLERCRLRVPGVCNGEVAWVISFVSEPSSSLNLYDAAWLD